MPVKAHLDYLSVRRNGRKGSRGFSLSHCAPPLLGKVVAGNATARTLFTSLIRISSRSTLGIGSAVVAINHRFVCCVFRHSQGVRGGHGLRYGRNRVFAGGRRRPLCRPIAFGYAVDNGAVFRFGFLHNWLGWFRGREPNNSRFGFGRCLGRISGSVCRADSVRCRRNRLGNRLEVSFLGVASSQSLVAV